MTGRSAKERSQFDVAVIAVQSIHSISGTPCQKGSSLSDTKKQCTIPSLSQCHNPLLAYVFQAVGGSWFKNRVWARETLRPTLSHYTY